MSQTGMVEFGGAAVGELDGELDSIAVLNNAGQTPANKRMALCIQSEWKWAFDNYGSDVEFQRNVAGAKFKKGTKAFFAPLQPRDVIGDIKSSDIKIIFDIAPLIGLALPMQDRDIIIRNKDELAEQRYTAIQRPFVVEAVGVNICAIMVANG